MCPVSQSNSCWQSLVGMFHVCRGGSTPNWLNRESESGMLISEMYLRNGCQTKAPDIVIKNFYLLPMPVNILDKGVGDTVPGELLSSGFPKHRMGTEVSCRVDHRHRCLVPVDVVARTEGVNDVQLDIREGSEGVEDETGEVLHTMDVLAHEGDALPIIHHVLVKVGLYFSRICAKIYIFLGEFLSVILFPDNLVLIFLVPILI